MAGRTVSKYIRCYVDGYDMSGYSRTIGPLLWEFDEADLTAQMGDSVRGYLPNLCNMSPGTLNGVFDNTATSGLHVIASSIQSERVVTVAIGDRAAPAIGDPVYCGQPVQLSYHAEEDGGAVTAAIPFGMWEAANLDGYPKPWGNLLHTLSAATAANSSGTGVDQIGASSAKGGYMVYHVTAASAAGHTATIKVQHSADEVDGNYADLGGCTTGVVNVGTAPISGIIPTTAKTTTVNRYLRWQVALGTATSVTFALSFVRGQ